jgi:HD-GYP domain-containing protein (c-di-GMP phosphodiesterase class II)
LDFKKRMLGFSGTTHIAAWVFIVIQYLFARQSFEASVFIPLIIGTGVFFILSYVYLSHIPDDKVHMAMRFITLGEILVFGSYVYITRDNPITGYEYLMSLPCFTIAFWYGVNEGLVFAAISIFTYTAIILPTRDISWAQVGQVLITPYGVIFIATWISGFMAESREHERKEKRRRTVEMTTLSGFATLFDSTLKESIIYDNLMQAVSRTINCDVVTVFAFETDREYLNVAAAYNMNEMESSIRIPSEYGLVGAVLAKGAPLVVEDTDQEPRYRQLLETRRIRSAIYAPMKWREETYGVITVGSMHRNAFNPYDLNLLHALSIQASVAIHNARLYVDLEDRIGELHAIFEIDKAITSAVDLDTVLQQIVQMSIGLFDAKISSLMLLDEETQELVMAAAHGLSEEYITKGNIKVGESIAGRVIQEGRPIAVPDITVDPRHIYSGYALKEGLTSLLSVPLSLKDKVIGVLNIYTDDQHNFTPHEINLFTSLASQAAIAIENARLFESLEEIYLDVITALASAIDARDSYTHGHSHRVTEYAVLIAEEMGLTPEEIDIIRNASILHDVGKIGIKEEILKKPGKLTEDETLEMQYHPFIGTRILQSVKLLEPVLPLVYHHQEKYDGSGYPEGLKGQEIPLGARVIGVCDAFEAMTSDRPYRKALPVEKALAELRNEAGRQFDPEIVEVFFRLMERNAIRMDLLEESQLPTIST